jgi:uncharacterized protein YdaU (DUF1376 family)
MNTPAFQFYPRQWLSDDKVMLMSWQARGMHMHLMCISWQQDDPCTLPQDDAQLKSWLGHPKNWPELKAQIFRAWKFENGRWVQEGLLREYRKQKAYSESRSRVSNARWTKKQAESEQEKAMHMDSIRKEGIDAYAMHNTCSSSSSSTSNKEPSIVSLPGDRVSVNGNHSQNREPPKSEPAPDSQPVNRISSSPESDQPPESPPVHVNGTVSPARRKAMFAEWYKTYPLKKAPHAAEKAFAKSIRTEEQFTQAMLTLKSQLPGLLEDPKFIPYPASYLSKGRWAEEIQTGANECQSQPYEPVRTRTRDEMSPR